MALPNVLVFATLCFELTLFLVLILPLPFAWRRSMFKFISESPIISKLQFGFKILFIFIAVLFVDAVQHMMKIHAEGAQARKSGRTDLRIETDWKSRKFLSERNMYLTGFTLFLSLVLSTTYSIIQDLIRAHDELAKLKGKSPEQVEQERPKESQDKKND